MPEIRSTGEYATFINTFRCRPADQAEVVQINVEIVAQVARTSPGFISASVHRSTDGTRVFNYLQCETPEHLAAMQRSPEFRAVAGRLAGLIEFGRAKKARARRRNASAVAALSSSRTSLVGQAGHVVDREVDVVPSDDVAADAIEVAAALVAVVLDRVKRLPAPPWMRPSF